VDRSIKVVRSLVDEFAEKGISEAELTNEQSHLAGVFQVSLRSYRSMARKLADYEQLGLPVSYLDSFGQRVRKVNLKQVNDAAKRYFSLKGAVTSKAGTFSAGK
jgi:predicted Zn-dependent peptidase